MKHQHIPLSAAELAAAHLVDAQIALRGALVSTETLASIEVARVPAALRDAIAIVDTCVRAFMELDNATDREGLEAARRVMAAREIA